MSRPLVYNPYEIYTMRMQGISTRQIAEHYGRKVKTLTAWCSKNKVCLLRLSNVELEEEIKIKTPKEIAFEYKTSLSSIYCRLSKLGLSPKASRGIK